MLYGERWPTQDPENEFGSGLTLEVNGIPWDMEEQDSVALIMGCNGHGDWQERHDKILARNIIREEVCMRHSPHSYQNAGMAYVGLRNRESMEKYLADIVGTRVAYLNRPRNSLRQLRVTMATRDLAFRVNREESGATCVGQCYDYTPGKV